MRLGQPLQVGRDDVRIEDLGVARSLVGGGQHGSIAIAEVRHRVTGGEPCKARRVGETSEGEMKLWDNILSCCDAAIGIFSLKPCFSLPKEKNSADFERLRVLNKCSQGMDS